MSCRLERIVCGVVLRLRRSDDIVLRVEDRNVRFSLHVEVDAWNIAELTYGIVDCRGEDLPNRLFVLELYFRFCGMNIDIDV